MASCAPSVAPKPLPNEVESAISASAAVSRNTDVLDAATPGMVVGTTCATDVGAADACWPVTS